MADEDEDLGGDFDEDVEGENDSLTDGLEVKKTSGKRIVIIAAAVVVLGLIIWGVMMFMGGDDESHSDAGGDSTGAIVGEDGKPITGMSEEEKQNLPVYHSIENLLVNLNTGGRGIVLLRISVSLELESEDERQAIELLMPTIMNDFQVYLRSLRPDDLEGTKGLTRIQEELLVRINQSIAPIRIRRVLFEDFLITPQ